MTPLQAITNIRAFNISENSQQLSAPLKSEYKIELVSIISERRKQVEAFVQTSYYNNFSAQLRSYFPLYLAVSKVSDNCLIKLYWTGTTIAIFLQAFRSFAD